MDSQEFSEGSAVTIKPLVLVKAKTGRRFRLSRQAMGYLFIAPAMIFLFLIIAYPLLNTLLMSFQEIVVRQKIYQFVGLNNYANVLTDSVFWLSLKNTVVYTVGSMVLHLLVGGFFA